VRVGAHADTMPQTRVHAASGLPVMMAVNAKKAPADGWLVLVCLSELKLPHVIQQQRGRVLWLEEHSVDPINGCQTGTQCPVLHAK
jgi:hypothetical protein